MLGADVRAAGALNPSVRTLLLDIEGTTTPITFVRDTLFPYARARVHDFLERHATDPDVRADLALLTAESAAEPGAPRLTSIVAFVYWLMDRDRKSTGLKALQGKIWAAGYRAGELHGEVYADVAPAFARWRQQGREIAIFSSGSVQAQRDLFAHTPAGDLTPFIRAYFDTTTGPKTAPESYARIATALDRPSGAVLMVSDVSAELDAAQAAGMRTALCLREREAVDPAGAHQVVRTLAEVA